MIPLWPVLEHYGWDPPSDLCRWQTLKCHIHEDSHASCRASSITGYVTCMACGFKGDAIDIIRHHEGVGFREALSIAERIVGSSDIPVFGGASRESGRGVPGRARDNRRGGRYVPPRLRRRASGGS